MNEIVEFVDGFRKAMGRMIRGLAEALNRIPAPIRENLLLAAREQKSIEKYQAAHEAERQAGLAYVRELGAQARRDLGLPEEGRPRSIDECGPALPLSVLCNSCGRALANVGEWCCNRYTTAADVTTIGGGA